MESWHLSMHKSSLLKLLILLVFILEGTLSVYIEDERNALRAIKASLQDAPDGESILPTWVDDGSSEYCDWERIKCDTTSRYVTHLSLGDIFYIKQDDTYPYYLRYQESVMKIWPLNISVFLHFKELRSLDLSWDFIGGEGLEGLSGLKKLEKLNLSTNFIKTNIFPSLSELTSLKVLDLSFMNLTPFQTYDPYSPAVHDISQISSLENLEVLDLTGCGFYGRLQMQASHGISKLSKIKILNLGGNNFNENFVASIGLLPSLTTLDLSWNELVGSFPIRELSHLTNLEKLDLSHNNLIVTSNIQGCKSLACMERLESVSFGYNKFNKSIISCLSFLPSLKILDLRGSWYLGSSLPVQELSLLRHLKTLDMSLCGFEDSSTLNELPNLPNLEVLILSNNEFNGTLPIEALESFDHLKVLDLSFNNFIGSIPSTIKSLSSLEIISLAENNLNGSLSSTGICDLRNLLELDLSHNMFDGNLPECFNMLSSLKLFDISTNQFTGILAPSLVVNLTSLEYIDFSHNKFEGSFSFSWFSNLSKLEFVVFKSDSDNFKVETEEPKSWNPMFQLKGLVLSNSNLNYYNGGVFPSFLLHQTELQMLDLSHNFLEGWFPDWMLKNNKNLETLILRNNLFHGFISMPLYKQTNVKLLDMSDNHMIGTIPQDIGKFLPNLRYLNFSSNALKGVISSSLWDLSQLRILDLSDNKLSGEVPKGLSTNHSMLAYLINLSKNKLHGEVLSGNLSLGNIRYLYLDNNYFTGDIGNITKEILLHVLDISDNQFSGSIPDWISDMNGLSELVVRNNNFEGQFPCVTTSISFLDISQNSFSGLIPSCFNLQGMKHLHLGSNRFNGPIPNAFRNLTQALTLDIGHNYLSGRIPKFLGGLQNLRILNLGKNYFVGSIPKQLCKLNNVSLLDLSSNSLTGFIPGCLQNIMGPKELVFTRQLVLWPQEYFFLHAIKYGYKMEEFVQITTPDEARFTTKSNSLTYKGNILDYMSGLDLSCNKLTGKIPGELGLLTQILSLNLSHNHLIGSIPLSLSNLTRIESMDLSSNRLSGKVPSELTKLNFLAIFNVSHNNLSGRLPEMKVQFATFTKASYEGNPLLCGPPLEIQCIGGPQSSGSSNEEGTNEKWYHIDKPSFYGSFGSMWFMIMLGSCAILFINPYWRKRWMNIVEECIYICYYFLHDLVRRPSVLFCN